MKLIYQARQILSTRQTICECCIPVSQKGGVVGGITERIHGDVIDWTFTVVLLKYIN